MIELDTNLYTTYSQRLEGFFSDIDAHRTTLHASRKLLDESSYPRIDLSKVKLDHGGIVITNMRVRPWCQEQFGFNWIWAGDTYYFKNEADLAWFVLKWL